MRSPQRKPAWQVTGRTPPPNRPSGYVTRSVTISYGRTDTATASCRIVRGCSSASSKVHRDTAVIGTPKRKVTAGLRIRVNGLGCREWRRDSLSSSRRPFA